MLNYRSLLAELESFYSYLRFEKRYSSHTIEAYFRDVEFFFRFLKKELNVSDEEPVDHISVRAWLVSLMEEGLQAKSLHRKIASLRSFFQFLLANGRIDANPMQKVSVPKAGKRLPVILQEAELDRLFRDVCWENDFPGWRDKATLMLLYGAGLRRGELVRLTVEDIDFSTGRIRTYGKGRKERLIPVPVLLLETLRPYLQIRRETFPENDLPNLILTNKGKPAYPNLIYLIVKKHLSLVTTLEKRSPHVLRHSYATHLSNSGAELNAVKELLGHSSLASTQVYMHNSIERLKKVYKKAHPGAGDEK